VFIDLVFAGDISENIDEQARLVALGLCSLVAFIMA